jgi:hypothetical protein
MMNARWSSCLSGEGSVHISAVCPRCGTSYQVEPSLRGQAMRCPNNLCRTIFVVEPPPEPAPVEEPAAAKNRTHKHGASATQQLGSVGDLVPILPAESAPADDAPAEPPSGSTHVGEVVPLVAAEPAAPAAEPEPPPSWHQPPPVRRATTSADHGSLSDTKRIRRPWHKEEPPAPAEPPAPEPLANGGPASHGPDTMHYDQAVPAALPADVRPEEPAYHPPSESEIPAHAPRGRWAKWAVIVLVAGIGTGLGGMAYWVYKNLSKNETELAQKADKEYSANLFSSASSQYAFLATNFKDSEHCDRYQFMHELCELRGAAAEKPEEPRELVQRMEAFFRERAKDPLLKEHGPELGKSLVDLTQDYAERAAAEPKRESLKVFDAVDAAAKAAEAAKRAKVLNRANRDALTACRDKVQAAVDKVERRDRLLASLDRLAGKRGGFEAIQQGRTLIEAAEAHLPGIGKDPEVVRRLTRLYDEHKDSVVYQEEPVRRKRKARREQDTSMLFDPPLTGQPPAEAGEDDTLLALSRGVLYFLRKSTGRVKWAVRVGIDTTTLPVRVPATLGSVERVLVLSSDEETLTAYDMDGHPLWVYPLSKPCLGRPVVVRQRGPRPSYRAYLATYDGQVHEVELAEGKCLGRYQLRQRLTVGGTRQAGSDLIYFPADDSCVYVLDVARRRCQAVLYTGHPSGSLRSEAIVVPPVGDDRRGYLILNQTNGLHAMRLRVYDLPVTDRHAAERRLNPVAGLDGWTWFRPHADAEKLVLLSDTGMLGLFGIRQALNADQALFPWLPVGGIDLAGAFGGERRRGRSEVVRMEGDDLWALAAGRLQRLRLAWGQEEGPRLAPAWNEPLPVGSPLHASQSLSDPVTGRTTLFLVTQPALRHFCLATSVDDEEGKVNWRRQLGLVCQGDPVLLSAPEGDAPVLLAQDEGGALFALDPTHYPVKADVPWVPARQDVRLVGGLDDNPDQPPLLLRAPDGKSAYVVASPGSGPDLVLRHAYFVGPGRGMRVRERKVPMTEALSGQPAVVGNRLLLPRADGSCVALPVPLPAVLPSPEEGPAWRDTRPPPGTRCYLVALGEDRFLLSDGGRGLTTYKWPANGNWDLLAQNKDKPTIELKDRVVTAPLVLPAKEGAPLQLCVADAGGTLYLLTLQSDGTLKDERTWPLNGRVTGGLFLRPLPGGAVRVGCVVGESRLVWIDPAKEEPAWTYATPKGDAIVGQPQLAEGVLVVADQSGLYMGLDPADGKRVGAGHRLGGTVAPAATPVAFGPGRLFAPLSDGTALLLSLEQLRRTGRKGP